MSISKCLEKWLLVGFSLSHLAKFQFGLRLLCPAGLSGLCGDLRAFLRAEGSGAGRSALEATKATEKYGSGILLALRWWFGLGRFANGLKEYAMGKLVWIARALTGAVRHTPSVCQWRIESQ
jgi:hypothetical protein